MFRAACLRLVNDDLTNLLILEWQVAEINEGIEKILKGFFNDNKKMIILLGLFFSGPSAFSQNSG